MARSVILGNSSLTVGLNEKGLVHDFYYPYVGLENLTTARLQPHKIGLWVDGQFSWLDDDLWDVHVDFEDRSLVSKIFAKHDGLGVELVLNDFVDSHSDIFARRIQVKNLSETKKNVRIFFHQVFQISAQGRADTVMYVPDGHYMLDYKGHCSILAYAETSKGIPFQQYAAGNAGIEGKEGTFRDAEDGELSMSAVEHGGVDSTLGVTFDVEPQAVEEVRYWLAVSDSQRDLEQLHEKMLGNNFLGRLQATRQHWESWLSRSDIVTVDMPDRYAIALRKSLMVVKAHTDKNGGIIASCDSSIYNYGRDYYSYVWPRDGAYVMWPLIKMGYEQEPKAFFEFCRSILHPDGYLMHKYQPDKAIGSTWHPLVHGKRKELAIQEDETAIVVYVLIEFLKTQNEVKYIEKMYREFIQPACNFMSRFIDLSTSLPHASYDLWEEKFLTSTYTASVTAGALLSAAELAHKYSQTNDAELWATTARVLKTHANEFYDDEKEHFVKGFLLQDRDRVVDATLDVSSFYGAWMFEYGTKQQIAHTVAKIEQKLLDQSPSGGAPRYENDAYFRSDPAHMGNPWYVTTLWMGQFYASLGKTDEVEHIINWTLDHALPSGVLSEQVNPTNGSVVGVTPLVWSHAELINILLML